MQRYFIDESQWANEKVTITEDAHHIIRVMRYEVGDKIICVHPDGKAAECEIIELDDGGKTVLATVKSWLESDSELPVEVTILQSLPKGSKLELIIQKGTELGATQFVLFESDRSLVKWNRKKRDNRLQRYQKIAKEASEQSGRTIIPEIIYIDKIEPYIKDDSLTNSLKILAYEEEAKRSEHTSLYSELSKIQEHNHILIAIGPEGGFSPEEVNLFSDHNFTPVRLGKRILRTETASLYALASISY